MATPQVLIVGAGPTGMTAAIELKRAGLDVRIIDKSMHLAEHSQALVVQARTLEQMQRYGIAAKAVERGRKLAGVKIWSEDKNILSFELGHIPSRYCFLLMLPQSETEAILNERMESLGVKSERGCELLSVIQSEGGSLSAVIGSPGGRQEEIHPRWLIGCDGAHSSIRERMGIQFEGGGVGMSFFLGDLELEGPDVPADELSIHFHHGDVVFLGRLNEQMTRVIVAVHNPQGDSLETPRSQIGIEDFQQAMDNAGVRVKIRCAGWMTPFHVNDLQARHYRNGNVFLAGDASHIHSPVGGQGMNTGIQDVANLAWKLSAAARGAGDALLESYEEERSAVGKALLRFTERGLKLASETNPLVEALRDALAPVISSLQPVQKAVIGFIAETAIEYRESSIVADHGGDGELKAGDRLPDLTLRANGSRSTLLEDWTDAHHLVLPLDASEPEIGDLRASMPHARIEPINAADLDETGRRLLGSEKKLLIVRPDGYVGFRGPIDSRSGWLEYAAQDALTGAVHA